MKKNFQFFPISLFVFLAACASPPIKSYTIRLKPGQDLKVELQKFAVEKELKAASVIGGVGSLKKLSLRFADAKTASNFQGPHEIVSIMGTLSKEAMHIHLSASDASGKTLGGHLVEGNLIYTTCELVLIEQMGIEFFREEDPTYGYKELVVRPR